MAQTGIALPETNALQDWIARRTRGEYALLIGIGVGALGGIIGLLIALGGPIIAAGVLVGVLAALYVLTNTTAALYGVVVIMFLLPFGTFPFRIGFTPTLLDAALGAFLFVYVLEWMLGRRRNLRLTPAHIPIALYTVWLIVSFLLGLRYAPPTSQIARQFAETLLSIGMSFVLVDFLRTPDSLRRLLTVLFLAAGAQAVVALALYALPDEAAERTLVRLARIGYPNGGVIRYIEDNPDLRERAIGTWVDPNTLGGFFAILTTMFAPQVFAVRPLIRYGWVRWGISALLVAALVLTFSRASMLGFAISVFLIGLVPGYRRFLPLLLVGAIGILILPQTQDYVTRFMQAFTGSDLATQMRVGEYDDSLELIARYPITGVGFTGTPEIGLYTDVASMYLIMANQIGLVGVSLFLIAMLGVFTYAAGAWRAARANTGLLPLYLGAHGGLLAVLLNSTADLYFFRLDFQANILLLWFTIGLALASTRLIRQDTAAINNRATDAYQSLN